MEEAQNRDLHAIKFARILCGAFIKMPRYCCIIIVLNVKMMRLESRQHVTRFLITVYTWLNFECCLLVEERFLGFDG